MQIVRFKIEHATVVRRARGQRRRRVLGHAVGPVPARPAPLAAPAGRCCWRRSCPPRSSASSSTIASDAAARAHGAGRAALLPEAGERRSSVPTIPIVYPALERAAWSTEPELAVVIKRRCRNVPPERVREYVLGYTVPQRRDRARSAARTGIWTRRQGLRHVLSARPVHRDRHRSRRGDDRDVRERRAARGRRRPRSCSCPPTRSWRASPEVMTLLPGDVVATGAPAGGGAARAGRPGRGAHRGHRLPEEHGREALMGDRLLLEDVRFYGHHGVTQGRAGGGRVVLGRRRAGRRPGAGGRVRRSGRRRSTTAWSPGASWRSAPRTA